MRSAMILGIVEDIIDSITGAIGSFLFGLLGGIFFNFIDWVQGLFRALAGLAPITIDNVPVNQNEFERQDLVWHLIQTDIVQDIFWSLVTFSLILMFMMTGLAIIRNAYQDKPKPIGDIIGSVFKGLLGMILVPIACMVGLMFGNVLLYAIDLGTSASGSPTLSGTLFLSAAYDANIARDPWEDNERDSFGLGDTQRGKAYKNLLAETNFETYLDKNGGSEYKDTSGMYEWKTEQWNEIARFIDEAYATGQIQRGTETLNFYSGSNVKIGYRLWSINYLVLVVGGCMMLGFLFKMCFGLIGRLFKLTIDFVMIPVVMAMMPFDTKPSQSWKGDFIKNTTLSYTTVGVMNVYFSLLPIVNKISFGDGTSRGFLDSVLKIILTIVGLFSAEQIISSVGGWFGTGDLLKEGASVKGTFDKGLKTVTDKTKQVGSKVGGTVAGAFAGAKHDKANGGNGFGGFLAGAYGGSGLKSLVDKQMPKGFGEARKAGTEAYDASRKFGFTDGMKERRAGEYASQQGAAKVFKEASDLGLNAKETKKHILASDVGTQIKGASRFKKAFAEYDRRTKNNEEVHERATGLKTYSRAHDKATAASQEVSDLVGTSFNPDDYQNFLSTGNMSAVQSFLNGKSEDEKKMITAALTSAKSALDAAQEASFKAVEGFMKENKYTSVTHNGQTYSLYELKNLESSELMEIVEDSSTEYLDENGAVHNISSLSTEATTLSATLEQQYADEAERIDSEKKNEENLVYKVAQFNNGTLPRTDPQYALIEQLAKEVHQAVGKQKK